MSATVALEGNPRGPVLAPDGQFLYLLDRGRPDKNPDKNVNGRLYVVSMETDPRQAWVMLVAEGCTHTRADQDGWRR